MEIVSQRHAPATLPPGNRPGNHFTGAGVGHRTGLQNLAPTKIRYPDRQALANRYNDASSFFNA
jgi:hypothetical protein